MKNKMPTVMLFIGLAISSLVGTSSGLFIFGSLLHFISMWLGSHFLLHILLFIFLIANGFLGSIMVIRTNKNITLGHLKVADFTKNFVLGLYVSFCLAISFKLFWVIIADLIIYFR
jgi:cation transporter-like permease